MRIDCGACCPGGVGTSRGHIVVVSLVHEQRDVGRHFSKEGLQVGLGSERAGRIVGIADIEDSGGGVGSSEHDVKIMSMDAVQLDAAYLSSSELCRLRDGAKCRRSHDEGFSWAEPNVRGHTQ